MVRRPNFSRKTRLMVTASVSFSAMALFNAAQAAAQDIPTVISPLKVEDDRNGVNIATGLLAPEIPVISVPASPHLRFDWVQNAAPYYTGKITPSAGGGYNTAAFSVHTGTSGSDAITCVDFDCKSPVGSGSTFIQNAGIYQKGGSGDVYNFNLKQVDRFVANPNPGTDPYTQRMYYASSVVYADGETLSYSYDTATLNGDTFGRTFYRPNRITSNLGYYITIAYAGSDFNGDTNAWSTPREVALFNASAPGTPLVRQSYLADGTITDLAGRSFKCTGCANALGMKIERSASSLQLPGEAGLMQQVTAGASDNIVASVVRDGVQWNYSYQNLRYNAYTLGYQYDGVTVSGPDGYSRVYAVQASSPISGLPNRITRITDSLNRYTSYLYDNALRVTSITYPEGNSVIIGYDDYGNIGSKTTRSKPSSGQADLSEYSNVANNCTGILCYRPTSYRDALNRQTDYAYNARGWLTEQTDPADASGIRRKTYVDYDTSSGAIARKRVVRQCGSGSTCGTSSEVRTEYDYWGGTFLPSTERRINGMTGEVRTTNYTYDLAGRVTSIDGPLAGNADTTYFRYDILGRKTWEIAAAGSDGARVAKRMTYRDSDDRIISTETGVVYDPASSSFAPANRIDVAFDGRRYAIRETTSSNGTAFSVRSRSFDGRGLLICDTVRMNPASNFSAAPADACQLGPSGSFGPDRITRNEYDSAGQLLKIVKAYGQTSANGLEALQQDYASYSYTPNGRRGTVKDANGNVASYSYDGYDRLIRWSFPSKTTIGSVSTDDYEGYGYDDAGNRTMLRKRDGNVINYRYDNLNRITLKDVPGSTNDVYYAYDANGRQISSRFGSPTGPGLSQVFNPYGELLSTSTNMSGSSLTLNYEYDAAGKRKKLTYPDGIYFTFEYDARGLPSVVRENGGTAVVLSTYDGLGRLTARTRGAVTTSYAYDTAFRLSDIADDLAGTADDLSTHFSYNPANQIVDRTRSNDAYSFTGYANVNRAYAVNGLNQYTSGGPLSFGYDANGNLTGDGTASYVYDVENRLISRVGGVSLSYDPNGRLWQTSGGPSGSTNYLYDGDELVAEYGSGGLLRRYVHGSGDDDAILWYEGASLADRRSLQVDGQNSVVSIAGANGALIRVNGYDEFGIPNANSTNLGRFQYTGQAWLPDLGMYHYKARAYSPTLGRFMQTDPIGYDDQINLYAYVANDPVNRGDPSGLEGELFWSAPGQVTYTVKYYVDTSAKGVPGFTDAGLQAQVAKDFSGSVTIKGQAVTITAQAVAVSKPGPGVNTIKVYPTTAGVTPSGRADTNRIGGNTIRMGSTDPAVTGSHELGGHAGGAGDQYKGGVGADGKTLGADVPGAANRMHDLGPNGANAQSLREIVSAPTNTNTCAKGVSAANGGC